MFSKWIDRIPKFLKNKYFLTVLFFLVWMLFLDKNNMISQYKLHRELNGLRKQQQFYKDEIQRDSTDLSNLLTDSIALEKYARENYMMKRENEEIFLITKDAQSGN